MPHSLGGDADLTNLVTCCPDCNQGKRDDIILSPFEWEDSDLRRYEALQRLAELRAFRDVKAELDRELTASVDDLLSYWGSRFGNGWRPEADDICYLLNDHDPDEMERAFHLASRRSSGRPEDAWRYACAILRNWRSQGTGKDRKG